MTDDFLDDVEVQLRDELARVRRNNEIEALRREVDAERAKGSPVDSPSSWDATDVGFALIVLVMFGFALLGFFVASMFLFTWAEGVLFS